MSLVYDLPGHPYDAPGLNYDGGPFVPESGLILPATFVQVALAADPLDVGPTWTTLPWMTAVTTVRGRSHDLSRFDAGTATSKHQDLDRRYDQAYVAGPYGTALAPLRPYRVIGGHNLLTENQSSLEAGATDGWAAGTNGSIAAAALNPARDGSYALALTATAAADAYASTTQGTAASPFPEKTPFIVMGSFLAAVTARTVDLEALFFDATGALISSQSFASSDEAGAWTDAVGLGISPADTAWAALQMHVSSPGAGEKHYGDRFALFVGAVPHPVWTRGSLKALFTGFVESVNSDRNAQSDWMATIVARDLFKILSYKRLRSSAFYTAVKALVPQNYWRCSVVPQLHTTSRLGDAMANQDGTVYNGFNIVAGPLVTDPDPGIDFGNASAYAQVNVFPFDHSAGSFFFWFRTTTAGIDDSTAVPPALFTQHNGDGSTAFAVTLTKATDGATALTFSMSRTVAGVTSSFRIPIVLPGRALNDGNWHFAGMVRQPDGVTVDIYIDGIRETSHPVVQSVVNNAGNPLQFCSTTPPANCALKDVFYMTSALADADVTNLYNLAVWPGESVGARLNRVLDLVGVPVQWRALDNGPLLQPYAKSLARTMALEHMQKVVTDDGGSLFVSAEGVVTYYALSHTPASPGPTFSDTGDTGDISYANSGAGPHRDDLDIWNELEETGDSIGSVLVSDLVSQGQHGVRTLPNSDSQLADAALATTKLNTLLARYAQPVTRAPDITYHPQSSPIEGFALATGVDLLDAANYKESGVGKGTPVMLSELVEHITHTIRGGDLWATTYALSPF